MTSHWILFSSWGFSVLDMEIEIGSYTKKSDKEAIQRRVTKKLYKEEWQRSYTTKSDKEAIQRRVTKKLYKEEWQRSYTTKSDKEAIQRRVTKKLYKEEWQKQNVWQ